MHVSFGDIEVRKYDQNLADHPGTTYRPSIGLRYVIVVILVKYSFTSTFLKLLYLARYLYDKLMLSSNILSIVIFSSPIIIMHVLIHIKHT